MVNKGDIQAPGLLHPAASAQGLQRELPTHKVAYGLPSERKTDGLLRVPGIQLGQKFWAQ